MIKSEIQWIDCKERMPKSDKDGYEFLVIVEEKDEDKNCCNYNIDLAWFGTYIDNFWDTCNDWIEGQEVHITHWAKVDIPKELLVKGE